MLYLMGQEGELQEEITAAKFRDQFFLHSYASQNPRLYHELYDEPDVPEEWEVPETLEDLNRMIAELGAVGIDLNATPDVPGWEGQDRASLEAQYGVRPPTQRHHEQTDF